MSLQSEPFSLKRRGRPRIMLAAVLSSTTSLLGRVWKKWFKSIKLAAISFYLKQNYFFGPFSFLCHTCVVRPLSVFPFLFIFHHHSLSLTLTPSLWMTNVVSCEWASLWVLSGKRTITVQLLSPYAPPLLREATVVHCLRSVRGVWSSSGRVMRILSYHESKLL